MIRILNLAGLGENPLRVAGSARAVLDLSTPSAPILCCEKTRDQDLQRSDGAVRIVVDGSEHGTRIVNVFQKSPLRIMFPRVTGAGVEEAVLINTGGGIAGGDRLEYRVTAREGASITVTSQAAEKVYGALDAPARINTKLTVAEGAKLAWLPQETILFNTARIYRSTEIDVSSGTEVLALEWLVLGRSAYGEQMVNGQLTDSWHIRKDGRLIWADSFRLVDEIFPQLHKKALLSCYKAIGTLVYYGSGLDRRLESIRNIRCLECFFGATLVGGVMVARFAAKTGFELRVALRRVLEQSYLDSGPGPFRTPKMWEC